MSGIDQKPPHDAAIPRFSQPRHLRWFALAALLGSITLLASLGLLALSGHFITATAIAGGSVASAAVLRSPSPSSRRTKRTRRSSPP